MCEMYACTHIGVETSKLFAKAGLPVDAVPSPGRASGELQTGGEIGQASNRRRASERLATGGRERGGPGERADAAWRNATARRPAPLSTDLRPAIRWRRQSNSLRIAPADESQTDQFNKGGKPAFRQDHDKDVPWGGARMHATELA